MTKHGLHGNILITGGAGYLGRSIIRRAVAEQWDCDITIFSTDAIKHGKILAEFPKVKSIIGDVRDPTTMYNAMWGMGTIIHAAAVKFIDVSEFNSVDTNGINVTGSLNVLNCAMHLGIPRVIGISTDKACHPANTYGASKYLMEKLFQEFSRNHTTTNFHLVRYGNVIDSTASVLQKWKASYEAGETVKVTDPEMTRFWLSPDQAVDFILEALKLESGHIFIPMLPALSIGKMAEYVVGDAKVEIIPVRPGEKKHETLITVEELHYANYLDKSWDLSPSTAERKAHGLPAYTSDQARQLSRREFMELLEAK
jgi:UDP-N-acetylglucosamine 4,6-dehydratase